MYFYFFLFLFFFLWLISTQVAFDFKKVRHLLNRLFNKYNNLRVIDLLLEVISLKSAVLITTMTGLT